MKILSIKMKYAEKKWPDYLEEIFGKETAEKFTIEGRATASTHEAKIDMLNFSGSNKILDILRSDNNVLSAFVIEDNVITKVIV